MRSGVRFVYTCLSFFHSAADCDRSSQWGMNEIDENIKENVVICASWAQKSSRLIAVSDNDGKNHQRQTATRSRVLATFDRLALTDHAVSSMHFAITHAPMPMTNDFLPPDLSMKFLAKQNWHYIERKPYNRAQHKTITLNFNHFGSPASFITISHWRMRVCVEYIFAITVNWLKTEYKKSGWK